MKWFAILFGLFIVAIIVLADNNLLGPLEVFYDFPFGDKVGHFILYGILTLLIDLALFQALPHTNRRLIAWRTGLILAMIIGLEEFSQRYFPSRTFDLVDLTLSYLGVVFFSWLALRIKKRADISSARS